MKTYIFVRNVKFRPSTYYRIFQYLDEDLFTKVEVFEYETDRYYQSKAQIKLYNLLKILFFSLVPGYFRRLISLSKIVISKKPYSIIIQRECFPKLIGPVAKALLKKTFQDANKVSWDFDDNILESGEITEYEKNLLTQYATDIIVPNLFLAEKVGKCQASIHLVPTSDRVFESLNLPEVNYKRNEKFDKEIILLWLGTKSNITYLENILPFLDTAAQKLQKFDKKLVLHVVSNVKLELDYNYLIIKNIRWTRDIGESELLKGHIGLMPLEMNYYTPGKAAFKAVQYMSAGMPTILSPVGYNNEVIVHGENGFFAKSSEEWIEHILNLSIDFSYWEKISKNSRTNWESNFNSSTIKDFYSNVIMQ